MEDVLKIGKFEPAHIEKCAYAKEIKNFGFTLISSDTFQKIQRSNNFSTVNQHEIDTFINSWHDLDMDNFMSDKGKYRTRKHATFTIQNEEEIVLKNKYIPHFQTVEYNHLNGGIARYFTEIDKNTINNPIFKNLLQFAYLTFSEIQSENWFVEAHQFRIKSIANDQGKPTPEGIHRDGVDFVLMALIKRENIQGGMSKIYDLNKNEIASFMLEEFLDIALVDDYKVYHSVTETKINNLLSSTVGLRDILGHKANG